MGSELKSQQGERGDLRVKAGCKIACRQENEQESLEMKTILGGEEAENSQNGVTEWKRRRKRRKKNRQRALGKQSDHYVTELTQGETSGKRIGPLPHKKKEKKEKGSRSCFSIYFLQPHSLVWYSKLTLTQTKKPSPDWRQICR